MNVYVIARRGLPNLGVHMSRRAADAHFEAIRRDRLARDGHLYWDHVPALVRGGLKVRAALFGYAGGEPDEEIQIERWVVGPAQAPQRSGRNRLPARRRAS